MENPQGMFVGLVLLIIFMVIFMAIGGSMQEDVPKEEEKKDPATPTSDGNGTTSWQSTTPTLDPPISSNMEVNGITIYTMHGDNLDE